MSGLARAFNRFSARFGSHPGIVTVPTAANLFPDSDLLNDYTGTNGTSTVSHVSHAWSSFGTIADTVEWVEGASGEIVWPVARRNITVTPGKRYTFGWKMSANQDNFAKNQVRVIVDGTTYYLQADNTWSTSVYEWTWPYTASGGEIQYTHTTDAIPAGSSATLDFENMYRAVIPSSGTWTAYLAEFQLNQGTTLSAYVSTSAAPTYDNLFQDSELASSATSTVGSTTVTHITTSDFAALGSVNAVYLDESATTEVAYLFDYQEIAVTPGTQYSISYYFEASAANCLKFPVRVVVDGTTYYLQSDGVTWSTTSHEWVPTYGGSGAATRISTITDAIPAGVSATLKMERPYRAVSGPFNATLTGVQVTSGPTLHDYVSTTTGSGSGSGGGAATSMSYAADTTTIFANPEIGLYTSSARTSGLSSSNPFYGVAAALRLQWNYRIIPVTSGDIPTAWLDSLTTDLNSFRSSDVKWILRFTYNYDSSGTDAPIATVLRHIQQLATVVNSYKDVIAVLQAGLIGAYGEWHGSSNNLLFGSDSNGYYRDQIIDALLTYFDSDIPIAFRRTAFIGPADSTGGYNFGTLETRYPTSSDYFGTTKYARATVHNDCLFIDANVNGYADNYYNVSGTRGAAIGAAVTKALPSGGESCSNDGAPNSYSTAANALSVISTYHQDYLHANFYTPIYAAWSTAEKESVLRKLGYRLVLTSASIDNATPAAGSNLGLTFTMRNDGSGKLYKKRPLKIAFVDSGGTATLATGLADVRPSLPLAGETKTFTVTVTVPAGLSGAYDLHLVLPDNSSFMSSRVGSMVRLANTGMWDASTGYNSLGMSVTV